MLPYPTLLQIFRTPLIRKNRSAVRFLSDVFYLLLALHRAGRLQDFNWLKGVYFEMIDSFAEYGQRESLDSMQVLLEIPWFIEHRQALLRVVSAYKHVNEKVRSHADTPTIPPLVQMEINRDIAHFVDSFKTLIDFDQEDEKRVQFLLGNPEVMDESLRQIKSLVHN